MKNIVLFSLFLSLSICSAKAQSIFGKWKTIDKETGKVESIVEVYKKDSKAFAKIVEILKKEDKDRLCTKCTGKLKNKPILGMVIVNGLKQDGNEWNGGKILDPKNGKYYKCYIELENKNKLKLRGYLGISLFGRTEHWQRIELK